MTTAPELTKERVAQLLAQGNATDPAALNALFSDGGLVEGCFNPAFNDTFTKGGKGIGRFIKEHDNPELDSALQTAAKATRDLRELQMLCQENRETLGIANGSFASAFVIPDIAHPQNSQVLVIQRNRTIGAGLGSPGGFLEAEDNGNFTPKREWFEELEEVINNNPLTEQRDSDLAFLNELIQEQHFVPLFHCRDDRHVIERGWGAPVDANAHTLIIPEHMREQAETFFHRLTQLQKNEAARDEAGNIIETKGVELLRLKDLPEHLADFHYGHEAFGALLGAQLSLETAAKESKTMITDYDTLEQCSAEQLDALATRMGLQPQDLRELYNQTLNAWRDGELVESGAKPGIGFSDEDYREAYETLHTETLKHVDATTAEANWLADQAARAAAFKG